MRAHLLSALLLSSPAALAQEPPREPETRERGATVVPPGDVPPPPPPGAPGAQAAPPAQAPAAPVTAAPLPAPRAEEQQLRARLAADRGGGAVGRALRDFYAARAHLPAWFFGPGAPRPQAHQLVTALCAADREGLSPERYGTADLTAQLARAERGEGDWLAVELSLTRAFLSYADDLATGQLAPSRFGWPTRPRQVDLAGALSDALLLGDVPRALEALSPAWQPFARLRDAYWHYRAVADAGGWPQVPAGPALKEGRREARVRVLRERLGAEGDLRPEAVRAAADPERFDGEVAEAVRRFQRRHGLAEDGQVAGKTLAALQVPAQARAEQLRLNLERWRWMPASLGERHVLVNLASFDLEAWEGGRVQHHMRVVVGEPEWRTPLLTDRITHLVVNPRWFLPKRILEEEVLPKLRSNPGAARAMGLEVVGPDGKPVAPESVDWGAVQPGDGKYSLRQGAGPENPLGDLKFVTTNNFDVILHDTPAKAGFTQPRRAMSHGCVRLADPQTLAAFVLRQHGDFGPEQLKAALESAESEHVQLPQPVPVHLLYWTAFVATDGAVHFRPDIYEEDAKLAKALPPVPAGGGACPGGEPAQGVGGAGPVETAAP
jgi:murein L,D-transpeptidase YcbB/YkuD